jgi:hypothetical protein
MMILRDAHPAAEDPDVLSAATKVLAKLPDQEPARLIADDGSREADEIG